MPTSWIGLSLASFIIGSALWIVGDIWLVGFAQPTKTGPHHRFIEYMGSDNFAYHLGASEFRLRAGALIANFSIPLLLLGIPAHWALFQNSTLGQIGVVLFALGLTYAPLAHASFYFLGEAAKLAHRAFISGKEAEGEREHAQTIYRFLACAWVPTIVLMLLGGILMALTIALGYTAFPRWAALLTAPIIGLPASQISRVPYPGRPALNGAGFNIAGLIWGISFALLAATHPIGF